MLHGLLAVVFHPAMAYDMWHVPMHCCKAVPWSLPNAAGIVATDHYITVPLVHGDPPNGETLEIFVRELVQPSLPAPRGNRPALLYLQGVLRTPSACRG
jgi:hypothetical protein